MTEKPSEKREGRMELAIVGRCPHGKIKFACSTRPEILSDCKKDIAEMVAAGFTMERVPVEVARKGEYECAECDKENREVTR